MHQTFRLRKAIKHQGMALAALYLPVVLAWCGLFLIQQPDKHGFKHNWGAPVLGVMGVSVFGLMLLISLYAWARYSAERFSIDETRMRLCTLLRNYQFDAAELRSLKWRAAPRSGSVAFGLSGITARLDLTDYEEADRLQIIRALRPPRWDALL